MQLTTEQTSTEELAQLIWDCLKDGSPVEIDGLGTFQLGRYGEVKFVQRTAPKVFLAYVREDYPAVEKLFYQLRESGFDPWLDRKKLLPGQNWPRAIERAIAVADFFIPCFSSRSVSKRGQFHCELRLALDCANRIPLDQVFVVPVRLDDCPVPSQIQLQFQYVDLFPDWERGFGQILTVLQRQPRLR